MMRNQGCEKRIKQVLWKRVLDVSDRSLRYITTGLGPGNGVPSEAGFDITAASELMAILCLAEDEADLRRRIENILLGYTQDDKPFTVKTLALQAYCVDERCSPNGSNHENTPAFVHGGPFVTLHMVCNSVLATK